MLRSTYDSPYNTYESDADLSHLIGNISYLKTVHTLSYQAQLELQELHTSTRMLQRATIPPQRRPSNCNSLDRSMSTRTRTTWRKTLSSSTNKNLLLAQRTGCLEQSLGSRFEFLLQQHFPWNPSPNGWKREEKYQSGELRSFVVTLPALDHCC